MRVQVEYRPRTFFDFAAQEFDAFNYFHGVTDSTAQRLTHVSD